MITETITIDNQTRLTVQYNGRLAFMYSRMPLIVRDASLKLTGLDLRLTHVNTGASFVETRQFYNGEATFDLSAIMRHLAPDVSTVMSRQRGNRGASETFIAELIYAENEIWEAGYDAIFGALNANESYRSKAFDSKTPELRRFWVNYPQTLMLTQDVDDSHFFELPSGTKVAVENENPDDYSKEADLIQTLSVSSDSEALSCVRALTAGLPQLVGLSNFAYVNAQAEQKTYNGPYWLKLLPDLTPAFAPGRTYLRWLQRDGSFAYWLFHSGEIQVVSSEGSSFQRYYANPNTPSYFSEYVQFEHNPRQADFKEGRTLNLGTTVNNRDEFEYLVGLLTSPVVDRYILSEDHDGWERVNVLPSTQAYSYKRDTPRTRQIELTIQLPDRDTIKL